MNQVISDQMTSDKHQISPNIKVLLTGASGFLGRYIYLELISKGYEVHTIGRASFDSKNHFMCDLGTDVPDLLGQAYDWVIHSAGKAHIVPRTVGEKEDFFRVNQQGLKHLLVALDQTPSPPAHFTLISTVAVYGSQSGLSIAEDDPLKAQDPYGKSKLLAESIAQTYASDNNCKLTILRLPLIAGANPPGNLGSMMAAMKAGRYFGIGKSQSKRSIVLASDVASQLVALSKIGGVFNLTDGKDVTFFALENALADTLHLDAPKRIPYPIAWIAALIGEVLQFFGIHFPINFNVLRKLTTDLTFSSERASQVGWKGRSVLEHTNELMK